MSKEPGTVTRGERLPPLVQLLVMAAITQSLVEIEPLKKDYRWL